MVQGLLDINVSSVGLCCLDTNTSRFRHFFCFFIHDTIPLADKKRWRYMSDYEKRTADDIINEYQRLHHGNPIRTIWSLVDLMKKNYEEGNTEEAELYYEAVVTVVKDKLATE